MNNKITFGTIAVSLSIFLLYCLRHQVRSPIQMADYLVNVKNEDQADSPDYVQIGEDLINVTNIDEAGHLLTG